MMLRGFLGLAPFFLSLLLAVGCALAYRVIRNRDRRRSPLADRKIGHVPGQQLVDRLRDHDDEISTSVMLMFLAFPMAFMAWTGVRINLASLHWGVTEWIFLAVALAVFCIGFRSFVRHIRGRDNARDGLLAERVTGMQLNRLVANGCFVLHDLPCDGFNIDHVVIAPRGVYAVETKSFSKPKGLPAGEKARVEFDGEALHFVEFSTTKPVEQARRQAQWLARYLRETLKESTHVAPALALPGWYVDKTEEGRKSDLFAFTPMGHGYEWFTYGEETIPLAKRGMIAQALAVRYPAIS